ncbi:MAG: ABC transporter ATP-binding protein [Candidatus Bathyarchaeia archaeon]
MPSLRLVNVSKRFGRIEALDDVTFNVSDGEYLCVLGPTGSGKTTLLRILAGLLAPDGGTIYFDEKPFIDVPAEERNVAYVPQTYALFPHMTVLENVMFGPLARGLRYAEAYRMAMEALKMVRLAHRADALPHELSGGMQQRVALARALASGAKLLLLDEPLGALDARLRIELRRELRALAKASGSTVIHVTHDQEEAMTIGDRILVLRNGRVQQHGTPFHVYRKPGNLFVASFVGSSNFLEGIVAQRNRKGSLLRLRGNLELRVSDTSHMPGEVVIIALREEMVRLKKGEGSQGKSALLGDVLDARFLGNSIRYRVRLENGDLIAARIPTGVLRNSFKPGDRVLVTFDPGDALIYGYPALGLFKELEAY